MALLKYVLHGVVVIDLALSDINVSGSTPDSG
jgi:hypothetical protein